MAFEVVKKLKCITNERKDGRGYVLLTVGEIYESACANSAVDSEHFMVFDDEGNLYNFNKDYFEVVITETVENTGWIIKCKDCCKEMSIEEIFKNDKICPRCGQKFTMS